MQQFSSVSGGNKVNHHTRHILIIDDSSQLRNLLARHIMLSCTNRQYSCTLYSLGERAEPRLNFYYNPEDPSGNLGYPPASVPDFAVYEAGSPRHALAWIRQSGLKYLTIISDVMMPVDTEIGLPGLLHGLHEEQIAVNLIFMSSETQSKQIVQELLNSSHAFFLEKGGENWSHLPETLVEKAEHFKYYQVSEPAYSSPQLKRKNVPSPPPLSPVPPFSPASPPPVAAEEKLNRRLTPASAVPNPVRPVPVQMPLKAEFRSNPVIGDIPTGSSGARALAVQPAPRSFWRRLLSLFGL